MSAALGHERATSGPLASRSKAAQRCASVTGYGLLRLPLPVQPCDVRHYHHEFHWVYRLDHVCPEPRREDTYAIVRPRIPREGDRGEARRFAWPVAELRGGPETGLRRHP